MYKIQLLHHSGYYLTAPETPSSQGSVSWQTQTANAKRQIWLLQASPTGGGDPVTIEREGHIVSFGGKGQCLNVYGNEVISPNRKVVTWYWDESNAQRWVVGTVGGVRKIFSRLEYSTYALNAYRSGEAWPCDVYPHVGNNDDSQVTLDPAGEGLYRIRLVQRGKYLTAASPGNESPVYWAGHVDGDSQLWKITTERPVNPDPGEPIEDADSTLVDVVIPARSTNFRNGRNGKAISEITIHHMDSPTLSVEGCGGLWSQVREKPTSSHYGVRENRVGQYVSEANAAYCNGGDGFSNDRAVTIEIGDAPATEDYKYPISEATFNTTVKLIADIAKRNGLGKLTLVTDVTGKSPQDLVNAAKYTGTTPPDGNFSWHCFYRATECPGDYLLTHLQDICDRANAINGY